MVEENYSDRLRSRDSFHEDSDLFLKTTTGYGATCMSPQLREWISEQMKSEASIMKERRRAREERQLQRAPGDTAHAEPKGKGSGRGRRAGI